MDLTQLNGITVPLIVGAVYMIITVIKSLDPNGKLLKYVPIIATLLGTVIGIITHFIAPNEIVSSTSLWSAAIIGAASGLASTGTNQIFKQLTKTEPEKTEA